MCEFVLLTVNVCMREKESEKVRLCVDCVGASVCV